VALNGLPGPYIKHFMSQIGHEGLNAMLVGFPTKAAEAICTFAYSAGPGILLYILLKVNAADITFLGTEPVLFEGKTEGTIVTARGPKVFGWDAVFEPLGTGLT
jgi:inosine triphosphate pyrophosphatase